MIVDICAAAERGAALLRAAVASGELPAAAFGVASVGDGFEFTEATGFADLSTSRSASPTTPFCLASTTKPITSTVVGALVDLGRLRLDDQAASLVLELPRPLAAFDDPTIRQLANHTAGVGAHHRFFYEDERPPIALRDAVGTLGRPAFPTGWAWRYSNLGYGALQVALERAGGAPMADLVRDHIFRPLGMSDSAWGGLTGPAGSAVRYGVDRQPYLGYVTDHPSASEAWCSIIDLLEFGKAHACASLLRKGTHAELTTPSAPRQPDGAEYALGWVTREYEGIRILVHGGRMGGVGAHLTVVPEMGLVVAGLANIETDRLSEAVATVLAATVPSYASPTPSAPWPVGPAHPLLAARWDGVAKYGDDELPVVLDATGDRITLSHSGITVDVVMPCLQPDRVAGHANLTVRHPLVPPTSICHIDLLPAMEVAGRPVPVEPGSAPSVLVGALTSAQYPNAQRTRQGDAISAAVLLHRTHRT